MNPFAESENLQVQVNSSRIEESVQAYRRLLVPANWPHLLAALGLSVLIFGISYVLNLLASKVNAGLGMTVMMLSVTTLGIAFSFSEKVRALQNSFQLGMYIICIFCFSVAASADFRTLLEFNFPIFCYVFVSIAVGLLLHALLSKLCKIDTDTFIVTSVSAVCSPPFVPAVAAALGNNAVLATGLATGVVGYALGNYLSEAVYLLYNMIS